MKTAECILGLFLLKNLNLNSWIIEVVISYL